MFLNHPLPCYGAVYVLLAKLLGKLRVDVLNFLLAITAEILWVKVCQSWHFMKRYGRRLCQEQNNKQTFEAEISTVTVSDTRLSVLLFQTITECSIVHFPQLKYVTKYVPSELQHRNTYALGMLNNNQNFDYGIHVYRSRSQQSILTFKICRCSS